MVPAESIPNDIEEGRPVVSRDLLKERNRQEDLLSEKQLEQANKSIERLNLSLDLLSKTVDSLDVRAAITGHLSSINAEIGWNIGPGQRIVQIDVLDHFKVRAEVEQYNNSNFVNNL